MQGHSSGFRSFVALVALVATLAAPLVVQAELGVQAKLRAQRVGAAGARYRDGEILVRLKDARRTAPPRAAALQGRVKRRFTSVPGLQLVELPAGTTVADGVVEAERDPEVLYAEPNYVVEAFALPNDLDFGDLWGLDNVGQTGGTFDADIDAPEAWNTTTGNSGVVVAVIDTGILYTHPDLAANMFRNTPECTPNGVDDDGNGWIDDCYGIDARNDDADPLDDNKHGTHVAGTIGAVGNNALGVAGVNWNVKLMACKFLDLTGSGSTADAVTCLDYVLDMKLRGVDVIATSNSWGGGGASRALSEAIGAHADAGILFVAAAGNAANDNDRFATLPAGYNRPNVIAVAASDDRDARATFSSFGARSVHLAAPGVNVLSTVLGNGYDALNGTSMATPHVTGVAALLKAADPGRDWRAIKNLILAGGDAKGATGPTITGRRLNARGALNCAGTTVRRRTWPTGNQIEAAVGQPIGLALLHITCASPAGELAVTVQPGGQVLTCRDDGAGFDQAAGDGIYSAEWSPPSVGTFTVAYPDLSLLTVRVSPDLIASPTPVEGEEFGAAALLVGSTLAAGAPGGPGAVHILDPTTGAALHSIPNPAPSPEGRFGQSLGVLGSNLIVGAPNAPGIGAAYLVEPTTGAVLRTFADPMPVEGNAFGWSVAGVGGNVLIGAPFDDARGNTAGAVYLFDGSTGALLRTLYLALAPAPDGARLGSALAVAGLSGFVGAPGGSSVQGKVVRFDLDQGSANFGTIQQSYLAPVTGGIPGAQFYFPLAFGSAIATDGSLLVVGDPAGLTVVGNIDGAGAPGAVHFIDVATGALRRFLRNPFPKSLDVFGETVVLNGDEVLIGSREKSFSNQNIDTDVEGAVYRVDAASAEIRDVFTKPTLGLDTNFGMSIVPRSGSLLVGAPTEGIGALPGGTIYRQPDARRVARQCYKPSGAAFTARDVTVTDALATRLVRLSKPSGVCNPGGIAGGTAADPGAHLTCYKAKDDSAAVVRDVRVVDAFNVHHFRTRKTSELCVASGVGGPVPTGINDYVCYKVALVRSGERFDPEHRYFDPGSFAPREVTVQDDFDTMRLEVSKPTTLCLAVGIDAGTVSDPRTHLTCYKTGLASGEPPFAPRDVTVQNRFGSSTMRARKPSVVCVPSQLVTTP